MHDYMHIVVPRRGPRTNKRKLRLRAAELFVSAVIPCIALSSHEALYYRLWVGVYAFPTDRSEVAIQRPHSTLAATPLHPLHSHVLA